MQPVVRSVRIEVQNEHAYVDRRKGINGGRVSLNEVQMREHRHKLGTHNGGKQTLNRSRQGTLQTHLTA